MLKEIKINNYAFIDSIEMSFNSGMTSITGETGAGKSILVGGLSLVLGSRVDNSKIININTGSINDDFHVVKDADWIVEAVVERIDIKHNLYDKIFKNRKPEAIVSSNTSSIPLKVLSQNLSEDDMRISTNSKVRAISTPYFGRVGKVISLPSKLMKMESETIVRVAEIEFSNGDREMIPRANLEMIVE